MAIPRRRTLLVEMALEQAQANYVRQVLGESANAIEEQLAKIGTSGNPLTRMQLEAQRSSIKAMLNQDFKNIQESIANGKTEAAKAASGVVSQYENQLLKAVMDPAAMRRIARSEAQRTVNNLEAAIKRMQGTSYNTLSKQVYKTKQLTAGWVDDIINRGLVSGWSAKQLSDAIIPSISPNVRGGVSYAANRLARTEINNAYHAASWDRYNRSAIVEEVEWLLSSSHPEDDICNDYAAESPFKKNAVPAKPHPNCYCYIVPRLPAEEEFLERLFAGEYGDEPWADEISLESIFPGAEKSNQEFGLEWLTVNNGKTSIRIEALEDHGSEFMSSYTANEREAMVKYASGTHFFEIRDAFKAGKPFHLDDGSDLFEALNTAAAKTAIDVDAKLYRAMQVSKSWIDDLKPGSIIEHDFYASTTSNFNLAQSYGRQKGLRGQKPVVLEILTPAGSHVFPGMVGIQELVIPAGSKMAVRSVTQLSKFTHIVVDLGVQP